MTTSTLKMLFKESIYLGGATMATGVGVALLSTAIVTSGAAGAAAAGAAATGAAAGGAAAAGAAATGAAAAGAAAAGAAAAGLGTLAIGLDLGLFSAAAVITAPVIGSYKLGKKLSNVDIRSKLIAIYERGKRIKNNKNK